MRGGPGGAGGFGGFGESFGDIFGDIFGQTRRQQGAGGKQVFRGNDLSYAMDVTLEEAAMGKESQIRIPSYEECTTCSGTGAKPGTSVKTCGTCQGQGVVQMRQGFFSVQQTCPHCRGSGKTITDPCTPCHGQGKVKKQKTLEIKIPAGIDDGMRIRSSGNGEPGTNGGPPGDLFIEIRLQKHDVFQRDGDDLHCAVPISFTTAALGGEIAVPTLGGEAAIDLPEGTQTGKQFRLRGKGIKGVRSGIAGDLFCHILIETPVKLTDKQKELLEEFDKLTEAGGAKHSPQSKSWMDKVKEFFE
jgi:molecular chaperone DnaJ